MAISKLFFLLSLVTLAHAVDSQTETKAGHPGALEPSGTTWDEFSAPSMVPAQFLIVSSSTMKKVVYTTLDNFQTHEGRALALIDTGLAEPKGIAFDHKRGFLYVADSGAKAIFRYTVLVDLHTEQPTLTTTSVRSTVIEGHHVEWVAVDADGNLFYTAPDTNNINKVSARVMERIISGEFKASSLQIVSEKTFLATLAADQSKNATMDKLNPLNLPVDIPPLSPHIFTIYESKLNPHVSAPASIWAEGNELYWANEKDGHVAGTVVKGMVHPGHSAGGNSSQDYSKPFPAAALTQAEEAAFGIAKTETTMFFTHNGPAKDTGKVSAFHLNNPSLIMDLVNSIAHPRGLVYDKDNTMYVADPLMGSVWSFPVGRLMKDVPLTKTVSMKGAYGLVIMNSHDPCYSENGVMEDENKQGEEVVPALSHIVAEGGLFAKATKGIFGSLTSGKLLSSASVIEEKVEEIPPTSKNKAVAQKKFLAVRPVDIDESSSFLQLAQADLMKCSEEDHV